MRISKFLLTLCLIACATRPASASLNFSASGDVVDFGTGAALDNMQPWTICAWEKLTTFGNGAGNDSQLFNKNISGTARQRVSQLTTSGDFSVTTARATTNALAEALNTNFAAYGTGKWIFVCFQSDTSTDANNRIFVGDASTTAAEPSAYVAQTAGTGTVGSTATANAYIGGNSGSQIINGKIGWIGVWTRILSQGEIVNQQYHPHVTTNNVLFSYLGFNGASTQRDASGNGNSGTITGATSVADYPPISFAFGFDAPTNPPTDIVVESTNTSGYQTAASTYDITVNCSGANRYIITGTSMLSVGGSSVSSISHDATGTPKALALIKSQASGAGAVRVEIWGVAAPVTGSVTLRVTLSAALDSITGYACLSGVNQQANSAYEGAASATATNVGAADATVNITSTAYNDLLFGVVASSDTAITPGQTSRWNTTGALGSGAGETYGIVQAPATNAMSYTDVGAAATWSIAGVAIRPVDASTLSGSTFVGNRMLMGVGK